MLINGVEKRNYYIKPFREIYNGYYDTTVVSNKPERKISMNYGERLKILREKHELTQADVASYIGTSQSYYAQYENGKRSIPFERAVKLAQLYDTSLDYISGLSDDINRKPH